MKKGFEQPGPNQERGEKMTNNPDEYETKFHEGVRNGWYDKLKLFPDSHSTLELLRNKDAKDIDEKKIEELRVAMDNATQAYETLRLKGGDPDELENARIEKYHKTQAYKLYQDFLDALNQRTRELEQKFEQEDPK